MRNGTALRAGILVAGLTAVWGCVDSPTAPAPAPPIEGDYTLTLDASSLCTALPTRQFRWDVQARTVGSGAGAEVRVTLPAGDDAVDIALIYAADPTSQDEIPSVNFLRGTLRGDRAPFGEEDQLVTIESEARGTVTGSGRGQVTGGTSNGRIALTDEPEDQDDPEADALGSCTAADHRWSLLPR